MPVIDREEWEAALHDSVIRLRTKVEQLEKENRELDAARIAQQVRLKMLAEQWAHGKAVKLLMAHEWVLDGRECINYCLHCQRLMHEGHADDCEGFGLRGVIPPDVRAAMERE